MLDHATWGLHSLVIPAGQHGDNNNAIRCEIMSVDKSDEESGREFVIDRERESTCPSCKV